jgi:hypothetical protein
MIERIDNIPWPVIALAGVIGFLTLIRYVHIQVTK